MAYPDPMAGMAGPALERAAELLRSLAGCLGILAAGLIAGFLARGIGGGVLVDGIAAAGIGAAALCGIVLAVRTLRRRRAITRDGDDAPAA